MRLAIADPPYLNKAVRWYGTDGYGHGDGQGRADEHPEAAYWDEQASHLDLLARLQSDYDGWAIAMDPASLPLYLSAEPPGVRVAIWHKTNAMPSASRVRGVYEPLLVFTPQGRRTHGTGPIADDVLHAGFERSGGTFIGRKPQAWTHWVLALLGYDPATDAVDDLFPGSGAVAAAIETYRPPAPRAGRLRRPTGDKAQRLRSAARGAHSRKAAVLAALDTGASIRATAREAGVATSTVQRWKAEAENAGGH
ncbi:Homeodomain-like domain-containing protein [Gordonia malaquae]|uniref:Uncharacterized protein n=1 Tax=Gordonia malaquae NBRC 108250 TaxID=1223542 RepID=M3TH92_GORML|nr:helix-turn-helix domain-containing protein [Gordonia malaquae]GAC80826.1 hypothetical protein GM1_022_00370 [Gordonia malaquae NBRC 108250]SEB68308.1 Homeodomain-like domain-containing protein [Gordonia malaquae]